MTVTDNGRVELDEATLAKARELTAGGKQPSKREMRDHIRKGWSTVNEVLTLLGREDAERRAEKARAARKTIRKLSSRKRSGSTGPVRAQRQRTVNEPIGFQPMELVSAPAGVEFPEAVQKHPEPIARAVNEMTAPLLAEVPLGPARLPEPEAVEEQLAAPVKAQLRVIRTWPILIVAAGAFVAIWAGWVGIGRLTGFGDVNLLPGLVDDGRWSTVNTAITLPLGMEAYSAYAFYVLLHRSAPARARRFAAWSSLGAVLLGMAGQTAYHLMIADRMTAAPWQITTVVSCLPVAVFGLAAALVHLVRAGEEVK